MSTGRSNYYPPRAGRRIIFRPISFRFRRWLEYSPFEIGSSALSVPAILWSAIIPGYIFRVIGQQRIFLLVLGGYLFALLVFLGWLGYPLASIAYMAMLSLHVTSIAQLIKHLTPSCGLKFRIISTVTAFLLLNVFVYGFVQGQLGRLLNPLRINDEVVVVRVCSWQTVKVGETIAYRIAGGDKNGFVVVDGFGLDQVRAKGGDVVRFSKNSYQVNSTVFTRESYMPTTGEMIVPKGRWFVWPKFSINQTLPEAEISKRTMLYAIIGTDDLVGKPCRYWFWRKQL
ncbi:MAG: hypothetical protein H0X66_17990 [Verrucomicrobia bacterium]|nr:hypothetical protein [Verrucomicrobiota bacterium]